MGLLSQEKTAAFLQRCECDREVEDVLSAYVFSKYANGSSGPQVLRKLILLTAYLRAIKLGHLIVRHYSAFALLAYEVKVNGGDNIGATPPQSLIGLECWNSARRPSKSLFRRRSDELTIQRALQPPTRSRSSTLSSGNSSEAEGEEWGQRGPGPVRVIRFHRGLAEDAQHSATRADPELARQLAGSGANSGLGSGLLSAPPTYSDEPEEEALPLYAPAGAMEVITVQQAQGVVL